jgi:hypothetical protein
LVAVVQQVGLHAVVIVKSRAQKNTNIIARNVEKLRKTSVILRANLILVNTIILELPPNPNSFQNWILKRASQLFIPLEAPHVPVVHRGVLEVKGRLAGEFHLQMR